MFAVFRGSRLRSFISLLAKKHGKFLLMRRKVRTILIRFDLANFSALLAAYAAIRRLPRPTTTRRSIIISGLGRVGKTIVANELAASFGYVRLSTDDHLWYFFNIRDDRRRFNARVRFYSHILKRCPTGLVIEGDDFVLENTVAEAELDHPIDLKLPRLLSQRFGTDVYLLGNADSSVESKLAAFRSFSSRAQCWTVGRQDLDDYASLVISVSKKLREWADGVRLHYLEINSIEFAASIDETVTLIASRAE